MRHVVLLGLIFLVVGCGASLSRIKDSQVLIPENQMGVVVMAYDNVFNDTTVDIRGHTSASIEAQKFEQDNNYFVTTLPAGEYYYTRVYIYKRAIYVDLLEGDKKDRWKFTVKPNQINYIGHLDMKLSDYNRYSIAIHNNSVLALEFLEKEYPNLIEKYRINLGMYNVKDNFFGYISELKANIAAKEVSEDKSASATQKIDEKELKND
jgi:hypothetical protein